MNGYGKEQLERMGFLGKLPRHVAIIMDGNGRWASERGLPRALGHRAGMERLQGIVKLTSDLGVEALTLYAFSTENWKRPKAEISALCELFVEYFLKQIDELDKNGVRIRALGEISAFPAAVKDRATAAMERTAKNSGLKLNIALNYGGRAELLRGFERMLARLDKGELNREELTVVDIGDSLDTAGLPELDLLIRTGGEQRLSNFLLYQAAYAELMFVPDYWPDFSDEVYLNCLKAFANRNRRFGGL